MGRVDAVLRTASTGLRLNEIAAATGMPVARVSVALLALETQSRATFRSGRWTRMDPPTRLSA